MLEKMENIGFAGCQKLKYEVNNQKQKLISETPTRSASDPISGITALRAYLFYSYLFLSKSLSFSPKKTTRMPP